MELPEYSDEYLAQLARDIHAGMVFTDRHIAEEDYASLIRNIFMPLVFIDDEQWKFLAANVGMLFEFVDKAGPRGINNYPTFMSFKWLTKEQTEKVLEHYEALPPRVEK